MKGNKLTDHVTVNFITIPLLDPKLLQFKNEKIVLNLCISYNGKISSFLFLLMNIRISDFKMA